MQSRTSFCGTAFPPRKAWIALSRNFFRWFLLGIRSLPSSETVHGFTRRVCVTSGCESTDCKYPQTLKVDDVLLASSACALQRANPGGYLTTLYLN
jgi:hypothetical protein